MRAKIGERGEKSWEQECWARTAGTGKPGRQPEKTAGMVQAGQEGEDGCLGMTAKNRHVTRGQE
jgi:hypothetical protein